MHSLFLSLLRRLSLEDFLPGCQMGFGEKGNCGDPKISPDKIIASAKRKADEAAAMKEEFSVRFRDGIRTITRGLIAASCCAFFLDRIVANCQNNSDSAVNRATPFHREFNSEPRSPEDNFTRKFSMEFRVHIEVASSCAAIVSGSRRRQRGKKLMTEPGPVWCARLSQHSGR